MTAAISFEMADVLIYDPVSANAETTRAVTKKLGFGKINVALSPEEFAKRLGQATSDLLICEVAGAETELCNLIQSLRQGLTGTNPFAVVLATTWRREGSLVNLVINSGADDLLARPFAISLLADRLCLHVERRKAFIVTADYVGPDRRRDPRSESRAGLIEVPNSLHIRAKSAIPHEDANRFIASAIAEARKTINAEKLRREAFQLCLQWRLIEHSRPSARDYSDMLERMGALATGVKSRAAANGHELAGKWCDSIIECTEAIGTMLQYSSNREPSCEPAVKPMMHLLGQAAMMLGKMFVPDELEMAFLPELDAAAARYDVRRPAEAVH
jgi:CheY-like chemotaxis protein